MRKFFVLVSLEQTSGLNPHGHDSITETAWIIWEICHVDKLRSSRMVDLLMEWELRMIIMASRPMTLLGTGDMKKTQCGTTSLIRCAFLENNTKTTTEETTAELMDAHFVHHTMCETKVLCKGGTIMIVIAVNTTIPEILEILDLARVSVMFRSSPNRSYFFPTLGKVLSKGWTKQNVWIKNCELTEEK
jgi:hypothetical protein